ncbi:glycosyltransferase family 2 protein [Synechocystis sp. LEGE 06083]|uniref:2'-O-glycosyltransferase CruG n=1 Tax=Synechocystis sp. LEGE 06083 TaxID=915336 RepID=UPI001881C5ED|nr:glycosyltransferase family 2 protein [Synechocystis sp. LEGE 06083]MBE9195087.1 glycosyltransferase family 2 protein [Synechocystis sp. LEGE 06083]
MLIIAILCLGLLVSQGVASLILLSRLAKGARRRSPLTPVFLPEDGVRNVSVVVPTLNEAARVTPCLVGLAQQGPPLREILVVDSRSTDGTQAVVQARQKDNPRLQLLTDDPLPDNWVGRPWALNYGFRQSDAASEWILGIDADTQPQPGLVASVVQAAQEEGYDILSLSPQFILQSPGEWWLQPALLMTLLYRFESAGVRQQAPETVMANGQCFLCRRSVLEALQGYELAARSFCDDVTLARAAAQRGYRVGFLDGANLIRVRMYEGIGETWREWGRSLDLKDATVPARLWAEVIFLLLVQGLPILLFSLLLMLWGEDFDFLTLRLAIAVNGFLLLIRWAMLWAIYPSYYRPSGQGAWSYWLSPLADPLAVARIIISASQTPKQWRGRVYPGAS